MQSGTTSRSWPPATTPSSPTEASPPGTAVVVAVAAVSVAYIHLLNIDIDLMVVGCHY